MNKPEFKGKGTGIISTMKYFEKMLGYDYFKSNWHLYYPDTSQNLLASSWYEFEPMVKWTVDCAKTKGIPFNKFAVEMSKYAVENDLNGVYKFLMKLGGAKRILDSGPQMVKSYMNFAELKTIENKPGYCRSVLVVPLIFKEFVICGQEGAARGILNVCGNKFEAFNVLEEELFPLEGIEHSRVIFELKYQ